MSLGGKYVFATVMSLVLPMCILISCSSVLCVLMALGMFMFEKIMSSLISVMSPLQTTQPTSSGFVTADTSCCATCVEPSRQQWGPD